LTKLKLSIIAVLISTFFSCELVMKTGDPNAPGLPTWPVFTNSNQKAMFLDSQPTAQPVPNMNELKAFDDYYAWRRAELEKHSAQLPYPERSWWVNTQTIGERKRERSLGPICLLEWRS
jgi:hypothetical protein